MKITKRQLRRIIREEKQKLIKENAHSKLNDDVTRTGENLDQELYMGLTQGIKTLVDQFANNPRYEQYGITHEDVMSELKIILTSMP